MRRSTVCPSVDGVSFKALLKPLILTLAIAMLSACASLTSQTSSQSDSNSNSAASASSSVAMTTEQIKREVMALAERFCNEFLKGDVEVALAMLDPKWQTTIGMSDAAIRQYFIETQAYIKQHNITVMDNQAVDAIIVDTALERTVRVEVMSKLQEQNGTVFNETSGLVFRKVNNEWKISPL